MTCELTNYECPMRTILHGKSVCGMAKGKELTDGFGYIEYMKICPLFVPSNFKLKGKLKAEKRYKLWLKGRKNESIGSRSGRSSK